MIPSVRRLLILTVYLESVHSASAQELEPRRWGHLPTGTNFAAMAYVYTDGDVFFNPVLNIEDAEVEVHTTAFKYIRTFAIAGKSARVDLTAAYQDGTSRRSERSAAVKNRPWVSTRRQSSESKGCYATSAVSGDSNSESRA